MKKHLHLLLISLLIGFALAGCNSGAADGREGASSPADEPAEDFVVSSELAAAEEAPEQEPVSEEIAPAPIFAGQIQDGTYAIAVSSSSSMFRIVDAQLTVVGEEMTALLTLSGTGYEKLYMGTGEEALADSDEACVYFVEDSEGRYTYEVPVAALDLELDVAAWSTRKKQWYDRVLVFQSEELPSDAIDLEELR